MSSVMPFICAKSFVNEKKCKQNDVGKDLPIGKENNLLILLDKN